MIERRGAVEFRAFAIEQGHRHFRAIARRRVAEFGDAIRRIEITEHRIRFSNARWPSANE
jgi:hypothetical protein